VQYLEDQSMIASPTPGRHDLFVSVYAGRELTQNYAVVGAPALGAGMNRDSPRFGRPASSMGRRT